MAEYITKEQAWNIARLAARTGSTIKALKLLDETPAADVVEVVRHKDCQHYVRYKESGIGERHRIDDGEPSDMDYCSHGKRCEDDACWLFKTNEPDNQKGKTVLHCSRCGSHITLEADLAPVGRCPACDAKMDTVMAEIENEVMGKLHIPLRAHSVMPYIDVMEVIRRKRE